MKARLLMTLIVSFFIATTFACGQKEEPAEEPKSSVAVQEEKAEVETEGGEVGEVVEEEGMEMEGSGEKAVEDTGIEEEAAEGEGSGEKGQGSGTKQE